MPIQKVEPDRQRVEELCLRFKELMEGPAVNDEGGKELRSIRTEIESMGLYLWWKANIVDLDTEPRTVIDVEVLIPKNITIQ